MTPRQHDLSGTKLADSLVIHPGKRLTVKFPDGRTMLNTIVEMTEERDCHQFRQSLSNTLRELIPIVGVAFVRIGRDGLVDPGTGLLFLDCPLWSNAPIEQLPPEMMNCIQHDGHAIKMESDKVIVIAPIGPERAERELLIVSMASFNQEHLFLLKSFARLYRNFSDLIHDSEHDALTGLLNRRVLETRLETVMQDVDRRHVASRGFQGSSLSIKSMKHYIAVFDIDHFKRINDTFGHLYGDEIILLMSRLMKAAFRECDSLFRYGGDEFVVVILSSSRETAKVAFERFRSSVEKRQFPQIGGVTISLGFAEVESKGNPGDVIGHADKALYEAKRRGRNKVCDYHSLMARGVVNPVMQHSEVEFF